MSENRDKVWKAFPLIWDEIALHDHESDKLRPLTELQSAILLGAIEHYRWPTRWIGLGISVEQLEKEIAEIKDRLMREESAGMATEDDIAKGMYKAFNWLALQVASGQYANLNFSTDADGVVTPAPDNGGLPSGDLPEDDPSTDYDETLAAQMGGTIAVVKAIELLLDKIDAYYGAVNGTPATILLDCQYAISQYFDTDSAAMDIALFNYYSYRNTNTRIFFDQSNAIMLYMFCKGQNERAFNKWMIDVSGYPQAKINIVSGILAALSDTFWSGYYADGASKPSTQYYDAGCVSVATQTLLNMVFAVTRNTTPLKSQHRMRIQSKGYALDTAGNIQDAYWYRTAAGVLTRSNWNWVHSAGSNLPSDNQVPYNAAHIYDYTIDLAALNQVMAVTPLKNAGMNAVGLTYPTPFEVTFIDLGEYAV